MARLLEAYKKEIIQQMKSRLGCSNVFALPKLEKIVINMGVGKAKENKKYLDDAVKQLALISGQKPLITKAKKAEAGFKIKQGNPIGCKVTLRGERMYEFLDRLISIVIPRFKDFQGLSLESFDKNGNYSLGIQEQSVFSEINVSDIESSQGMDITLVIANGSPKKSYEFLKLLGMPFKSRQEN